MTMADGARIDQPAVPLAASAAPARRRCHLIESHSPTLLRTLVTQSRGLTMRGHDSQRTGRDGGSLVRGGS